MRDSGKIDGRDVGKPDGVAAVIAFLAPPRAAFIHGATPRIDGARLDRRWGAGAALVAAID